MMLQVPMTFIACLHAQLQNAREAAAAAAAATTAAAPAAIAGPSPPRIMIAGGEKSGFFLSVKTGPQTTRPHIQHPPHPQFAGKSSLSKTLANYAVRLGHKVRASVGASVVIPNPDLFNSLYLSISTAQVACQTFQVFVQFMLCSMSSAHACGLKA
jgi:hypothetical protein